MGKSEPRAHTIGKQMVQNARQKRRASTKKKFGGFLGGIINVANDLSGMGTQMDTAAGTHDFIKDSKARGGWAQVQRDMEEGWKVGAAKYRKKLEDLSKRADEFLGKVDEGKKTYFEYQEKYNQLANTELPDFSAQKKYYTDMYKRARNPKR